MVDKNDVLLLAIGVIAILGIGILIELHHAINLSKNQVAPTNTYVQIPNSLRGS